MKLFNLGRGSPDVPAPPTEEADAYDDGGLLEEDDGEPEGPDAAELIDASMRQVTERMQKMSSTLDAISSDRKSMEGKLSEMDERMRKLSMLTEMMSNRYNPFIGSEFSPSSGAMAAPDTRAAAPPTAPAAAAAAWSSPKPAAVPREAGGFRFPQITEASPRVEHPRAEAPGPAQLPPPPGWARDPDAAASSAEFQRQLGVLALAEHLLRATSRVGALELLGYYERLAWMGPQLRRDLLIAMEGLPCKHDGAPAAELRAVVARQMSVDFHVQSLALLHRIRGSRLSEEDVAVLRRDLTRFGGGD